MNVITQVDGDFADIRPLNESDRSALASKLLGAAGDRRREVRTVTGRSAGEFRVPLDIARAAGLLDAEDADEAPSFAEGGVVADGVTVTNDTGVPEQVLSPEQVDQLADASAQDQASDDKVQDTPAKAPRKSTSRSKATKAAEEKADDDKAGDDEAAEDKS
jgi:hypothetical protein